MKNEVIFKDAVDRKAWQSLLELSKALQEKIQGPSLREDFLADIHTSLLKPSPTVKSSEEILPSRIPSKTAIEEMLRTGDWMKLHALTKNDAPGAAIGTLALADKMLEALRQFGDVEKLDQHEQELSRLRDLVETLEEMKMLTEKESRQIDRLQHKVKRLQQQHEQKADEIRDEVRAVTRRACRDAQKQVQEISDGIAAWGSEPGKPVMMDLARSLEIARQLLTDPKLRKIAELAGRMRSIALSKRETKLQRAAEEVVDIEFGNNLPRVLPAEYMSLGTPAEVDFWRKFTEGILMQQKLQGKAKSGKGPIIFCLDESGSMAGDKEVWSKAYFLGMQALAAKEKRDIAYITFGTQVTRAQIFPRGQIEPRLLCEIMSCFSGHGGTAFDPPLEKALEICEQKLPTADIVFITDGIAQVSAAVRQKVNNTRKKGLHLYTILAPGGSAGAFKSIADNIVEDTEATEIYENL